MDAAEVPKDAAASSCWPPARSSTTPRTTAEGCALCGAGAWGTNFVCEISDHGPGDPLVGYIPPHPGNGRGSGLWVARQLTERLEMISSDRVSRPGCGS